MIKKSKILLETFLSNNPLNFEGKLYNVTTEAQSHLNSVIKASEYAQSLNIEYTPLWNSIEGIREPYSLDTLKTLFIEIQKYVALFVIQQQKIEQDILNIKDIIELLNYNIEYNLI